MRQSSNLNTPVVETASLAGNISLPSQDAEHQQTIERLLEGQSPSDKWLIQLSDWCSPILVKETRQALKSKQFTWTFVLLLFAVVCWTFFGVLSLIPSIYFFPHGTTLLAGYLLILIVPMVVIVPNAAYRSMASELDQGTFDVLTISPLSPLKVVVGKLAVALVQSLIYMSALAPCIALTYLLRGVPLSIIAVVLGWVAIASIVVSCFGLFLAAMNRIGSFSTMLSILMILISLITSFFLSVSLTGMIFQSFYYLSESFYIATITFYVVVLSYGWLAVLGAAASIGVAGENYSTSIRLWALIQSLVISSMFFVVIAFVSQTVSRPAESEAYIACYSTIGIHWAVLGSLFIGERGITSPRTQRTLPSSLLGRVFLTWMNPGGGPGFFFTICSFAGLLVATNIIMFIPGFQIASAYDTLQFGGQILAYLIMYLGIGRLIMIMLPETVGFRSAVSMIMTLILLGFGALLPLSISFFVNNWGEPVYEWYTFMNVFWTLSSYDQYGNMAFSLSALVAVMVLAVNFVFLTKDITMVRIQIPDRNKKESLSGGTGEMEVDPLA